MSSTATGVTARDGGERGVTRTAVDWRCCLRKTPTRLDREH